MFPRTTHDTIEGVTTASGSGGVRGGTHADAVEDTKAGCGGNASLFDRIVDLGVQQEGVEQKQDSAGTTGGESSGATADAPGDVPEKDVGREKGREI